MPQFVLPAYADVEATIEADVDESLVAIRKCESVGYWFEAQYAPLVASPSSSPTTKSAPGALGKDFGKKDKEQKKKGGFKMTEDDLKEDWYELMGLENGEDSNDDEIRTAYRKKCLETHPDKQKDGSDVLFKKVQRGFDLLGNPESRRAYDSSRPFDDTIPGANVTEEEFYESFGPVFDRNKKWSVDSVGIPSLGDENTPIKEVSKFYTYWMTFTSWRDFSHECELEEINEGMSREEKRFYQRENQRLLDKSKREESKRIRTLVERAQAKDPRLLKSQAEEKAKREKEVADRQAERERVREEERRRKQYLQDSAKREEEEKAKAMKDSKSIVRAAAVKLMKFLEDEDLLDAVKTNLLLTTKVRSPNVRWVFNKVTDGDVAEAFVEAVMSKSTSVDEKDEVPAVVAFNEELDKIERKLGMNRYGEPVKAKAPEAAKPAAPAAGGEKKAWDEEDLVLLQKAIVMYPGGTVERWKRMAIHLRDKFSEEEVLAKTKEMEKIHQSGDKEAMKQKMPNLPAATHADPKATTGYGGANLSSVDDWSEKQQKQLEGALRELKDYTQKDKYQKVSMSVEGKNAKQCFERFKHVRAMLNKK